MTNARTIEEVFREICAREGPLKERLQDFSDAVRELSLPFAEAYDDLVARLEAGEAGAGSPKVGDLMPPFLLPGSGGRLVSLDALLSTGPAVISFNRGHWCEYCAIEISALTQALNTLVAKGVNVVSIMPETREFVQNVRAACGGRFEILSDMDNGYALDAGLVIWLGERVRAIYLQHGLNLERYQDSESWFLPIPATFVVGRNGRIAARYVDPDFRRRMEIDDIMAAVDSLAE
ncbi:peroxiredoxin-like family protein [uncultured Hyphomicrobium sp.]|uniref:peroxiredoxin-like family protein n=1 Tax=uncultured Hyphomicrobium sp. TaxID=194373 RepID=UPI0025FDF133|nr:peroxiredoxin-like family protein [uncultured Hyphomicrobium sp.]